MPVKVRRDNIAAVVAAVRLLTSKEILVGIPGANAERREDGDPITNVELGYIHEFGAPEQNIPARPFLIPGIRSIRGTIIERMRKVGMTALSGNTDKVQEQLEALGTAAASAVQRKITDGPFEPLKESTKLARLRRMQRYQKASESKREKMRRKWLAGTFKPLIDTGALRQSITFVIDEKKKRL